MLSTLRLSKYTRLSILVVSLCGLLNACSLGGLHNKPSAYQPSNTPMQDVQTALESAKSANKLLLVVMGAQWCHDSTGLVDKFADEKLQRVLSTNYYTVFVDVGYYNDLSHITQRFEQAHYYATPTVMIINPQTERLINASDMNIWGFADSLPLTDYLDYFNRYANNKPYVYRPIPAKHIAKINTFEKTNARRLTAAYQILIPNLQLEDNTGAASDLFITQWLDVKRYRTSLQKDIQALRQQAINEPDTVLEFPSYRAFSWEQETQ
jgi:hypothetical protein